MLWGILWRSENKLDGKTEHLIHNALFVPMLFSTRKQARMVINYNYGYIRERKDLQQEPHGWKMPIAVKVEVKIKK